MRRLLKIAFSCVEPVHDAFNKVVEDFTVRVPEVEQLAFYAGSFTVSKLGMLSQRFVDAKGELNLERHGC